MEGVGFGDSLEAGNSFLTAAAAAAAYRIGGNVC